MEKIWLKSYPPDMPETIDVEPYQTLNEGLEAQCKKFADKTAFTSFGVKVTYRQLEKQIRAFAAFLQQRLQMRKGERFAVMLPNVIQFPIAMFGALRAGLIVVNVNPLYTTRELIQQMKDSKATGIIVLENFAHVVAQALVDTDLRHVIVTRMGDCLGGLKGSVVNFVVKHVKHLVPLWEIPKAIKFKEVLRSGKSLSFENVSVEPDDVAFLQYTGGTTGVPKGTMLTHRNIVANVTQCVTWVKPILKIGEEKVVTALPLYHIFSLTVCCFCFMELGSESLLITNPRDIKGFIKELRHFPTTIFPGINTLLNALLQQPNFSDMDFSSLKLVIAGGMALQKSVAERWHEKTGLHILEGYGLSEASPVVTINPLTITGFTGSIGLPVPNTEVMIRDEDGNELPINESGELCVRGPQVMKGYWQKPEETAKVLDKDGWLATGDIAKIDKNGFVYLLDRKKDMVIVSGFNVYPNEVEDVLTSHPGIQEAAVIGVLNENGGESVKAFVVLRDENLTKDDIISFCRGQLTGYKIPKLIEFRDELPKTNVGKVLRRAWREEEK